MDPATTQEIGQRLAEMESTLAALKGGLPFTFMWASALVVGTIEVLVWGVGWPVKRFENAADAYMKKKGENLARKSDLDDVLKEVRETRRATAQIEQDFGKRKFVSERAYVRLSTTYLRLSTTYQSETPNTRMATTSCEA